MSEDINTDEIRENLKQQDSWLRLLFIVIYAAALWVTSIVLFFVVVIQFLSVLFTREAQENLLRFGGRLAEYVRQIVAYMTFNSEHKPFPFGDWPDDDTAAAGATKKTTRKKAATKKKTASDGDPGATT